MDKEKLLEEIASLDVEELTTIVEGIRVTKESEKNKKIEELKAALNDKYAIVGKKNEIIFKKDASIDNRLKFIENNEIKDYSEHKDILLFDIKILSEAVSDLKQACEDIRFLPQSARHEELRQR